MTQCSGGSICLVNNAGFVRHTLFKDHSLDDMEQMMRTNYLGTVAWMKHAVPKLKALFPTLIGRAAARTRMAILPDTTD